MSSIEVSAERKAEVFAFMEKMNLLIENSAIQHLANNLRDDLSSDSYESIPRFLLLLYREIMHNRPDDDNQYVALEAFLKACYESVRGYNLDARGVDRNKQLRNYEICAGGIANKFCEILIDQSDLILFYFVGAETISRKLQAELFQHTRSVYNTLRISDPISARRDFTSLSDNAEAADIIAKIWDEKRSSIRDCVHAEFYGFITPANLDKEIDKFENAALPYIPSPCHFTARRFYSADFVEWFRSTNISLSVARQGVRSFGEFSEGNNLTPSTIDSVPEPQNKRIRNG